MENMVYQQDLKRYTEKKNLLLDKSNKSRFCQRQFLPLWEGASGSFTLTEQEKQLNETMENLRKKERENACYGDNKKIYPAAQPFYAVKDHIISSPLYQIFRLMPKGALLHVHSSAALSPEGLIALFENWNIKFPSQRNITQSPMQSLYVLWNDPIPVKWQKGTLFYQWFLTQYTQEDKDVLLKSCVPLGEVLAEPAFRAMLTFTENVESCPYRWESLNAMFSRTANLFEDKEFYREYHKYFFLECLDDNIEYVEMRSGFASFYNTSAPANQIFQSVLAHPDYQWQSHFYFQELNAQNGIQNPDFLDILLTEIASIQKTTEGQNFNLRVILNARRDLNPEDTTQCTKLLDKLNSAILFHAGEQYKKYHDFVIGFDFVSEEDRGYSTSAYHSLIYGAAMQMPLPKDSQYWIDLFQDNVICPSKPRIQLIDFYLHDGESTWSDNANVVDACIASHYRIGHGFNLIHHPYITESILFNKDSCGTYFPMLELCPISNQLLMYYPDLRCHPALSLMRQGIQCVICNDDPQMFGNGGLSYDFWMAYMEFGIDLLDIKRLVFNAYYAKSNYEKSDFRILAQWEHFIEQALEIQTNV